MIDKYVKITVMVFIALLLFGGCDASVSSAGKSDISIKAHDKDDELDTLSTNSQNDREFLQKFSWKKIKADVSQFYLNDNFPTLNEYTVEMKFEKRVVTAYADCQKITANYKLRDSRISFSNISIAPAVELATCIESQYADDAVLAFFENDFLIEHIEQSKAKFSALDFDALIELYR